MGLTCEDLKTFLLHFACVRAKCQGLSGGKRVEDYVGQVDADFF